ncbi:MAG: hypothetical protein LLG20_22280 [Acidobacteriales bacterium]|nr:hypothetical protein [Terriglobales bacterium]
MDLRLLDAAFALRFGEALMWLIVWLVVAVLSVELLGIVFLLLVDRRARQRR